LRRKGDVGVRVYFPESTWEGLSRKLVFRVPGEYAPARGHSLLEYPVQVLSDVREVVRVRVMVISAQLDPEQSLSETGGPAPALSDEPMGFRYVVLELAHSLRPMVQQRVSDLSR
jgi:hypothetical protein